eukprot:1153615-Pelagomonas_calceolata.AAC.6
MDNLQHVRRVGKGCLAVLAYKGSAIAANLEVFCSLPPRNFDKKTFFGCITQLNGISTPQHRHATTLRSLQDFKAACLKQLRRNGFPDRGMQGLLPT